LFSHSFSVLSREKIMNNTKLAQKWILLVLFVVGITILHYGTAYGQYYFDVFYGELYFFPIALAAFWFGMRGALLVSLTITACYLPYVIQHWQNSSMNDFDRVLSLLLYNSLAVFSGFLKDREAVSRQKLSEAESLIVMGKALAAAAHDMKTPLMLIGGLARRILKKIDNKDMAREKLVLIIKETDKMDSMTRNMLDFSKPLTLNRIQRCFDTIVQDSLKKVHEEARKHNVTVEYNSYPKAMDISVDALRLEQVIVNLVVNAIEASPDKSTVAVTLSQTPEEGLIFDVADCGCGIPFKERQKVFNPFFTTKKEGTGLGLPIVKKIVEAHGWTLHILDNGEGGTIFRVDIKEATPNEFVYP